MQIVVTVPDQYALDFPANKLARRLKLSAALLLFRAGQFSAGAACEFAGVDRYDFLETCRQHRIDAVDYDPDEIETDFAALIKAKGTLHHADCRRQRCGGDNMGKKYTEAGAD